MRIIDKYNDIINKNLNKEFKNIFNQFKTQLQNWNHDFTKDSIQASIFAIWEIEFHTSFLADQIPNRKLRETMVNQPDSDLFLMDVLEGLEMDPHNMDEF